MDVTALLRQSGEGDSDALDKLFAVLYAELHAMAQGQRSKWDGNYTVNTTALVHEAYLKLIKQDGASWNDRAHFLAVATRAMRHVLINYAERQKAEKRGGDLEPVALENIGPLSDDAAEEIIGTDHCDLGYVMAREWKLPTHVQNGIKYHHDINKETSPSSEAGIIQLTDFLVSELNYPAFKNINATLSPDLADYIHQNNDEFKVLIQDLPDEISKAEKLFRSDND